MPPEKTPEAPPCKMLCPKCGEDHPLYNTKTTLGEGGGFRFQNVTFACAGCGAILGVQMLGMAPLPPGKPS